MKNSTTTPTPNVKSLELNDLVSIFGGNDDVIDPDTLLGDASLIIEDYEM